MMFIGSVWYVAVAVFVLGLIVGSFLNVVILRGNTGVGVGGRSHCFSCGKQLAWYELIPVLSYLMQRGRCRTCHSAISIQYPIVELATAILFVVPVMVSPMLLVSVWGIARLLLLWILASIIVWLSVYDIRHQTLPVRGILACGVIGLVFMCLPFLQRLAMGFPATFVSGLLPSLLAGVLIPLPFFLLWLFSRGRLFGLGDVELMVPIGWSLGIVSGIIAVIGAFWVATIAVIIMLIVGSRLLRARKGGILKQAIPFGPFLLGAWYVVLVFAPRITVFW